MANYSDDILYTNAASREVRIGAPLNSEGTEGDELWCFVEGNDSGLYHTKKYGGEWRYRLYTNEILGEGDFGAATSTVTSTVNIESAYGEFEVLKSNVLATFAGTTTISGNVSITANTIQDFPTNSANLVIDSQLLDTVQDIGTTSYPQFKGLGLNGVTTDVGNLECDKILGITAATIVNNSLELYSENYTDAANVAHSDGIGLGSLTQDEVDQLENIGTSTISTAQWDYLGALDQHLTTASDVVHSKLSLTQTAKTWIIDPIGSSGTNTLAGDLQITTSSTTNADIIFGGSSYDDHSLRSWAYTSGLFTGDGWSIHENNNLHNLELDNLSVRGTLSVFELLIQQVRATNGSVFVTSASKIADPYLGGFYDVYDAGGNSQVLIFETDEDNDKPHPFADGDLILSRRVDTSGDTTEVVAEVRATVTDAGYSSYSDRCEVSIDYSTITLPVAPGPPGSSLERSTLLDGLDFVRVGSTTNANRRGGLYLTSDDTLSPFMDIFDGVSSWQEWDGITNIFGLDDGSFDLATVGTYTVDGSTIPGSSWQILTNDNASIQISSNGGISNQKYCKLIGNDGTAYVEQAVTFAHVSSGNYDVMIEWYGRDPDAANAPRIGLSDTSISSSPFIYWDTSGAQQLYTSQRMINWTSITDPSAQPDANNVWHRYQWNVTIPSGIFSGTSDKTLYLVFATKYDGDYDAHIDDVRLYIDGKVKVRIGRLEGVGKAGYGLWGENVFLKGRIEAQEGYIGNEFAGWRIDSTGLTNEGTQSYISSGQGAVSGFQQGGAYLDGAGQFSLGGTTGKRLSFDSGGILTIGGDIAIKDGRTYDGNTDGAGLYAFSDRLGYFDGESSSLGDDGWTSYIDSSGDFFLKGAANTDGIAWDSSAGTLSITGDLQFFDGASGPYKYPRLLQYVPAEDLNFGSAFLFATSPQPSGNTYADYPNANYEVIFNPVQVPVFDMNQSGYSQSLKIQASSKTAAGFTPECFHVLTGTTRTFTTGFDDKTLTGPFTGNGNGGSASSSPSNTHIWRNNYTTFNPNYTAGKTSTDASHDFVTTVNIKKIIVVVTLQWVDGGGDSTDFCRVAHGVRVGTIDAAGNFEAAYYHVTSPISSSFTNGGISGGQDSTLDLDFTFEYDYGGSPILATASSPKTIRIIAQKFHESFTATYTGQAFGGWTGGDPVPGGANDNIIKKIKYQTADTDDNEHTGYDIADAFVIHKGT